VNSYVASSLSKDYPFQLITTFMLDLKLLSLQILDIAGNGFLQLVGSLEVSVIVSP